jgi:trk system potassium uptake protein TrkA
MVALTNEDEVNILSSVMAKKLGCRRSLSLLNNPSYPAFANALGIDAFINPRAVTISKILQHVRRGRIRAFIHCRTVLPRSLRQKRSTRRRWSAAAAR